ncbi:hypothetical protein V8G54_008932 [Vigna mungo]|uniref:Uncharacterized protein n=1 Tax=Vigna mungo TaxID=3915 RepID=A0AAQ3P605_VIGMU
MKKLKGEVTKETQRKQILRTEFLDCVFQFQLYSLTSVPPHQQKIFGAEQDTPVTNDYDLIAISDKLRLVSVKDTEPKPEPEQRDSDLLKSDEELARLLQISPKIMCSESLILETESISICISS